MANNFKVLRLSKGLTVEELAIVSGIHIQTINAIESDKDREPRRDTMIELAKGLGVSYEAVCTAIYGSPQTAGA